MDIKETLEKFSDDIGKMHEDRIPGEIRLALSEVLVDLWNQPCDNREILMYRTEVTNLIRDHIKRYGD